MPKPLLIDSPVFADIQKITPAIATTAIQLKAILEVREQRGEDELMVAFRLASRYQ